MKQFTQLLDDAKKLLYLGYKKFTKMSTLVRLYKLKVGTGWSNKSFIELLGLIKEMIPDLNELPKMLYLDKNVIRSLGINYEKIHACPNDCIL